MTDKNKMLRAKKALELACNVLDKIYSTCPLDLIEDEVARSICLQNDCDSNISGCWKTYFYGLADKEGYK